MPAHHHAHAAAVVPCPCVRQGSRPSDVGGRAHGGTQCPRAAQRPASPVERASARYRDRSASRHNASGLRITRQVQVAVGEIEGSRLCLRQRRQRREGRAGREAGIAVVAVDRGQVR